MPYSLIASASGKNPDAGITNTPTSPMNTTGATLLIAGAGGYEPNLVAIGSPVPTVFDSRTNIWTPLPAYVLDGAGAVVKLWYSVPTSVGSGHTVSITGIASTWYPAIAAMALSGAHATPLDLETGAETPSATSLQPGSLTPTQANALVVSVACLINNSVTGVSGLAIAQNVATVAGQTMGLALGYAIQTAAAPINPLWSWTGATMAAAAIAAFKAAATGFDVKLGSAAVSNLKVGASQVSKLYVGSTLV